MSLAVVYILTAILMVVGLIGVVVPLLPGASLIFLGALIYGIGTHFEKVGPGVLAVIFILMILTFIPDYLGSIVSAKKAGISFLGKIGAAVGGVLGFVMLHGPIGALLGVLIGVFMAELVFAEKSGKEAWTIAWKIFLGFLAGTVIKFFMALAMILIFVLAVL